METRKQLTDLVNLYEDKGIGLEQLLDKIEALYQLEPKVPLNTRMSNFKREVFAWNYRNKNKYGTDMLESFIQLWTRLANDGTMKLENETNFKIGGRLSTFYRLNKQFHKSKTLNNLKAQLGAVNPLR